MARQSGNHFVRTGTSRLLRSDFQPLPNRMRVTGWEWFSGVR